MVLPLSYYIYGKLLGEIRWSRHHNFPAFNESQVEDFTRTGRTNGLPKLVNFHPVHVSYALQNRKAHYLTLHYPTNNHLHFRTHRPFNPTRCVPARAKTSNQPHFLPAPAPSIFSIIHEMQTKWQSKSNANEISIFLINTFWYSSWLRMNAEKENNWPNFH